MHISTAGVEGEHCPRVDRRCIVVPIYRQHGHLRDVVEVLVPFLGSRHFPLPCRGDCLPGGSVIDPGGPVDVFTVGIRTAHRLHRHVCDVSLSVVTDGLHRHESCLNDEHDTGSPVSGFPNPRSDLIRASPTTNDQSGPSAPGVALTETS